MTPDSDLSCRSAGRPDRRGAGLACTCRGPAGGRGGGVFRRRPCTEAADHVPTVVGGVDGRRRDRSAAGNDPGAARPGGEGGRPAPTVFRRRSCSRVRPDSPKLRSTASPTARWSSTSPRAGWSRYSIWGRTRQVGAVCCYRWVSPNWPGSWPPLPWSVCSPEGRSARSPRRWPCSDVSSPTHRTNFAPR